MKRRELLLAPAVLAASRPDRAARAADKNTADNPVPSAPHAAERAVTDLRHYGADPTGIHPSDEAIASAITACGASGGTVHVGPGTYSFAQPINLSGKRSIIIAGDGVATSGSAAASRITYTGTGEGVFINMNSAVGCQLRGLQITHRDPHFTGAYVTCSNAGANDPAFCALLDCVLGSAAGPGNVHLDLDKCIEFTAERCNFIYGNPSVRGRSARGYANAIRFRDCQWSACHSAPVRGGGQSWMFSGCTFEGLLSGAAGALLSEDSGGAFNGLTIVGCWFGDVTGGGTWLDIYGNGVHASGNYISGNSRGPTGVALHRSVGVHLAGNLLDQLLVGFDFADGPCRDIVIQGNIANLVTSGFRNAENVPATSLVWAPNHGLGSPGSRHVLLEINGYAADATCGLIRQWGATPIPEGSDAHKVDFPTSFPSQCLSVVATLSGTSSAATVTVGAFTRAHFESRVRGASGSVMLYWQALGT